jgi:hypothetical protein
VSECEFKKLPFRNKSYYTLKDSKLCFRHQYSDNPTASFTPSPAPIVDEELAVDFVSTDAPSLVKGYMMSVKVIGGAVQSITFLTNGIQSQNSVLEQLKAKYGTPTSVTPEEVQNRLGAKFGKLRARWELGDIFVTFQGFAQSLDTGSVTVSTAIGDADMKSTDRASTGPVL